MAQGDPRKWHMPGWRIEQKYSPGVLIGNWGEDRYTVSIFALRCGLYVLVIFHSCRDPGGGGEGNLCIC